MDRLRAIGVFVEVANAGSLSGAARQTGEPLTNVSRLLAQLEEHLGLTLIERTTRRMVLTAAGRDYLTTCRSVLDALNGAEQTLAGKSQELSGEISVTAPVGLGRLHVLPLVTAFLKTYPLISVRLIMADRIVDLMSEDIDVAVRVGRMKDSELRASRVGTLQLVTCAAPTYLAKLGTPSTVAAIAERDCITFADIPGGSRWVFASKKHGRHAVRVRSRFTVNTADAAVAAAIDGLGIVRVLSYQARAAIDGKLLVPILERFDDGVIPINVVYRPARQETARVRAFVRFLSDGLRATIGERASSKVQHQ
ncbi:MAG: LysR family transcriptional regulator [Hyphomicrobium sp.]|nr:LysR family transcriptional regulator [Hyphomicrobium sp.]